MVKVDLYTGKGFTKTNYVTTVIVPPFMDAPDVIFWGCRVFTKYYWPKAAGERGQYQECFAVAAVINMDESKELQ